MGSKSQLKDRNIDPSEPPSDNPLYAQLSEQFQPVFADIRERATVTERFLDRNLYRIYIATLWSNVVLSPDDVGILEEDLPELHDLLVDEISDAIGAVESLHEVFQFIASKDGEAAMQEARINQSHKDMLMYFASMILDPDGHNRFIQHIRDQQQTR